jgi:hypothetical protein
LADGNLSRAATRVKRGPVLVAFTAVLAVRCIGYATSAERRQAMLQRWLTRLEAEPRP